MTKSMRGRLTHLIPAAMILAALRPVNAEAQNLTVVTFNAWSGLDYKGYLRMGEYEDRSTRERRTEALIRELRDLAPDVVALNEANKLPRYARRLARELGYDQLSHLGVGGLRAGPVGLPTNLREGDVILARPELDLESTGREQLSGGPVGSFFAAHLSDATQVLAGRIRAHGREVFVFCTHWHASPFPTEAYLAELKRRRDSGRLDAAGYERRVAAATVGREWRLGEARKMLAFVERVAGDRPAILLGDFNALPESDEIALLRQAGFVDAFAAAGKGQGITWDEERNANIQLQRRADPDEIPDDPLNKRIDFVFVRGGLEVKRAGVVLDRPVDGLFPSDHYGVFAEIALP